MASGTDLEITFDGSDSGDLMLSILLHNHCRRTE
jgi:hypothetical protein